MLCPEVMDWFCHELSVYREQPDLLQALPKHLAFSLSVGEVGGKKGLGRPPSSLSPVPPEFPKGTVTGKWSQDRGKKPLKRKWGSGGVACGRPASSPRYNKGASRSGTRTPES